MPKLLRKISFWWHCRFLPRITGKLMWKTEKWNPVILNDDIIHTIEVIDA